jgi:hypothetical protein
METLAMNTEFLCQSPWKTETEKGKDNEVRYTDTGYEDKRWMELAHVHAKWNTLIKLRYYWL